MTDDPVFETLRVEVAAPGIGHLTLARPGKLNALSRRALAELADAARWFDTRPDVHVVIVRGEGRAFSAGFDLADFTDAGAAEISPVDAADLGRLMAEAVSAMRAVTIAAVQGHCVGGGLVLAASCDLRLVADDVSFSIPEVDLGIPLAWGGIPRLVRELGPAVTMDLVLTCRRFGADEALALRFVNRVVPAGALDAEAEALAAALAAKAPVVLRSTKQQVRAATEALVPTVGATADAYALAASLHDPEARAAALRYLESRDKR